MPFDGSSAERAVSLSTGVIAESGEPARRISSKLIGRRYFDVPME
jgi:hypothetical protein